MKKNIEDLLKLAERLTKAFNSDKIYCGYFGIFELIQEGANIIKNNVQQVGGTYVTEVVYRGYIFQTVSDNPLRLSSAPSFSEN